MGSNHVEIHVGPQRAVKHPLVGGLLRFATLQAATDRCGHKLQRQRVTRLHHARNAFLTKPSLYWNTPPVSLVFMKAHRYATALLSLFVTAVFVHAQTTATPIKHVVVIFDENQSFDHYFGTYPNAANPQDEPAFKAAASTPEVNGLSGVIQ